MANPKGNASTLKPYVSKWKSGQTQTIRVPVILADSVLAYARRLDDSLSQVNQDTQINANHLTQVIQLLNEALLLKANAGGAIKTKIREALQLLSDTVD